MRAARMSSPRS